MAATQFEFGMELSTGHGISGDRAYEARLPIRILTNIPYLCKSLLPPLPILYWLLVLDVLNSRHLFTTPRKRLVDSHRSIKSQELRKQLSSHQHLERDPVKPSFQPTRSIQFSPEKALSGSNCATCPSTEPFEQFATTSCEHTVPFCMNQAQSRVLQAAVLLRGGTNSDLNIRRIQT